ncbi:MAG: LysM peptidoglycan-binding domain-containing protein, partial [Tatlockia sp.]|nr:LysM peptidoglycan-binding domain-containing protein [Tatlockia sp.]
QPGDSYLTLENKYKVSTASIQNWNNIRSNSPLEAGTQLIIWKHIVQYGAYTVKTGDSLNAIAKRNNTDVKTLTQLNPSIGNGPLKPGQQIVLG